MRYFEQDTIALRYHQYRPQVHILVLKKFFQLAGIKDKLNDVLDVACGTGHSTAPLVNYANHVLGIDISSAMLDIARQAYPAINFQCASAENLPCKNKQLDGIFTSMALHWFNQPAFISEVIRTLKQNGWLFTYNMVFPGIMAANPDYQKWHQQIYWSKFPNPNRHSIALNELVKDAKELEFITHFCLELPVYFNALELRNYLTTQSNVTKALTSGQTIEAIDQWLDNQLKPFFNKNRKQFSYLIKGEIAQKKSHALY
jgi:ubiquinone/menaquinone biosynthesis C-methylase UbiE